MLMGLGKGMFELEPLSHNLIADVHAIAIAQIGRRKLKNGMVDNESAEVRHGVHDGSS